MAGHGTSEIHKILYLLIVFGCNSYPITQASPLAGKNSQDFKGFVDCLVTPRNDFSDSTPAQ